MASREAMERAGRIVDIHLERGREGWGRGADDLRRLLAAHLDEFAAERATAREETADGAALRDAVTAFNAFMERLDSASGRDDARFSASAGYVLGASAAVRVRIVAEREVGVGAAAAPRWPSEAVIAEVDAAARAVNAALDGWLSARRGTSEAMGLRVWTDGDGRLRVSVSTVGLEIG